MKQFLSSINIRQFLSYFGVGGVSALVEWVVFTLLESLLNLPYLLATVIAFVFSTTVNWLLGRRFTFRHAEYRGSRLQEAAQVFLVSAIGLVFNMLLMLLFVDVCRMDTHLLKTAAKILSTGIVFVWNYLSRKLWIYRT